jgi:hypothetical protein
MSIEYHQWFGLTEHHATLFNALFALMIEYACYYHLDAISVIFAAFMPV